MRYTTMNFSGVKASASYTCTCGECGKTLNRKAVVEHTINPFNKNEDGSVKNRIEVRIGAQAEADKEAAKLQGSIDICRDCDEAPMRNLLLEMAVDPQKVFSPSLKKWGSPMHVLFDRKQVEYVHERCTCGSSCCSGYKNPGLRITKKGLERARSLLSKS